MWSKGEDERVWEHKPNISLDAECRPKFRRLPAFVHESSKKLSEFQDKLNPRESRFEGRVEHRGVPSGAEVELRQLVLYSLSRLFTTPPPTSGGCHANISQILPFDRFLWPVILCIWHERFCPAAIQAGRHAHT